MANKRHQLEESDLRSAINEVKVMLVIRMEQKGMGSMASNHEILGILDEEYDEYRDAIHAKGSQDDKVNELVDIAVAALFGIASIRAGGVDW
ncbi:hypothetical protein [Pantanalinema sp. GBBB05]|uniref:hypothetical protein n=1 Tax=Pantanalinema sp. GBBB05 TaxID=2604139 RepID=UPI001D5AF9D7|nr:hypothetical protein [Pantanalinema sp. GBBB05]